MTIREIGQCLIDAIGGALFIAAAVISFYTLPGLLLEWLRGVM